MFNPPWALQMTFLFLCFQFTNTLLLIGVEGPKTEYNTPGDAS